jgi:hypothetical protein
VPIEVGPIYSNVTSNVDVGSIEKEVEVLKVASEKKKVMQCFCSKKLQCWKVKKISLIM